MAKPIRITILGDASSVSRALRQTATGLDSLSSRISSFAASATRQVAQVGAAVAAAGVFFGGKYAANIEAARLALENMLGSAERGAAMYNQLVEMSRKSPFDVTTLVDGAKQMVGLGVAAKNVIPMLQTVIDVAAGLGMGTDQIERFIKALSQMSAKGKIQAEELTQQLAELGIDGMGILAAKTGKSREELMKLMEQGKLMSATYLPMLMEGLRDGTSATVAFGGSAEKLSGTWKGMGTGLKREFGLAFSAIAEAIKPVATGAFPGVTSAIHRAGDATASFIRRTILLHRTLRAAGVYTEIREKIAGIWEAVRSWAQPAFDALAQYAVKARGSLVTTFGAIGHAVVTVFKAALPALTALRDLLIDALSTPTGPAAAFTALVKLAAQAVALLANAARPLLAMLNVVVSAFQALPGPVQTALLALTALRLLLPRLANSFPTTGMKAFSDHLQVQSALARANGVEVSRLGAAMATMSVTAQRVVPGFRGLLTTAAEMRESYASGATAASRWITEQHALTNASGIVAGTLRGAAPAFDTYARAAGGAANALSNGLRNAVTGLIGALGGPWGLALGAAIIGLSLWSGRQEQAAERARAHQQAVAQLTDTLDRNTGAITQATHAHVAKALQDAGALKTARELGISTKDLVAAALQEAEATRRTEEAMRRKAEQTIRSTLSQEDLNAVLQATGMSMDQLITAMLGGSNELEHYNRVLDNLRSGQEGTSTSIAGLGERLKQATGPLKGLRDSWTDVTGKTRESINAWREANGAAQSTNPSMKSLSEAMSTLSDNTADADSKARALNTALDALSGGQISAEQAAARLNERLSGVKEAIRAASGESAKLHVDMLNANGSINTTTEGGRRLLDVLTGTREAMHSSATAAYQMAIANGQDVPAALAAARGEAQRARDEFVRQAQAAGLSREQANQLANAYGLLPDQVQTLISQPGMLAAQGHLNTLRAKVIDVPDEKTVIVDSTALDEAKKLEQFGYKVTQLPNKQVQITADTDQAKAEVKSWLSQPFSATVKFFAKLFGPNALGNIYEFYAAGGLRGVEGMSKMSNAIASIVRPNFLRVVGDRQTGREAFIPLNREHRSLAILAEAARTMGEPLASDTPARLVAAPQVINHYAITVNATTNAHPDDIGRSVAFAVKTLGR
ncbi:tape measure protein [Crossiella sp. NPDC003009]